MSIKDLRPDVDVEVLQESIKSEEQYGDQHRKVWRHKKKDGEIMYVDVTGHLMDYKGRRVSLVLLNDVTERHYNQQLDKLEKHVLELNIRNEKDIKKLIRIYLTGIESLHPGMHCSVQEIIENKLFTVAAPSLPKAFINSGKGIPIGDNMGSCGTAAFKREKVIVSDISTDRRWEKAREKAAKYNLKACWSFPIIDNDNFLMATYAAYFNQIKSPTELEEKTLQRVVNFLQLILAGYRREKALRTSNERFEYAAQATSDVIWDWDLETNKVYYSGNIQKLFGHNKAGVNKDNLPFFSKHVHPDDRERVVLYPDEVKNGKMKTWSQEYRFQKADGEYAFVLDKGIVIRDQKGIGKRMIGAIQDITTIKQQNERLNEIALINAHEIRRPVATILGLMQLFSMEFAGNENNRNLLKHLETATEELDSVIRRIIDKTES